MNDRLSECILDEWIHSSESNYGVLRTVPGYDSGLPITNQSVLGALLAKYSMATALNGKIRLFGGDEGKRASLPSINKVKNGQETMTPGLLVVADDVCGGIYAINNGFVKGVNKGNVVFLPANSLSFEDLEIGHADFVRWCMTISENEWSENGWKTSEEDMRNLREADEYIQAKLKVISDLGKG